MELCRRTLRCTGYSMPLRKEDNQAAHRTCLCVMLALCQHFTTATVLTSPPEPEIQQEEDERAARRPIDLSSPRRLAQHSTHLVSCRPQAELHAAHTECLHSAGHGWWSWEGWHPRRAGR